MDLTRFYGTSSGSLISTILDDTAAVYPTGFHLSIGLPQDDSFQEPTRSESFGLHSHASVGILRKFFILSSFPLFELFR